MNIKKTAIVLIIGLISCDAWAKKEAINWQEWSRQTFELAKKQNKPVFINVGHEGCIACRWMKEVTYTDENVIELINNNFIAIQVDSEMRPDIGDRYSDWSWPALIFNKPDGTQVLGIRGNRKPESFKLVLEKIIQGHKDGSLQADTMAPYAAPDKPTQSSMLTIRNLVRDQLDSSYDQEYFGWGETKILQDSAAIMNYAMRMRIDNDEEARKRFFETTDMFLNHVDPIWGGVFYESYQGGGIYIYEKRLETQASALEIFATAYQVTGQEKYANALNKVYAYLTQFMQTQSGLYFANQQINLPQMPDTMTFADYYKLDDIERRKIGVPSIDHSVYTDFNARIASGFALAYDATNDKRYLQKSTSILNEIVKSRQLVDGRYIQFSKTEEFNLEERIHEVVDDNTIYLRTHGFVAQAFLDVARASRDKRWLDKANEIVSVFNQIEDKKIGGFYSSNNQIARKSLEDNAVAAYFLYQLGTLTHNELCL